MSKEDMKQRFDDLPQADEELRKISSLLKIQAELKAPKNQKNTFGGYSYRSSEDILEAVKPLLVKYSSELNITDAIQMIGDRFYVEASARFLDSYGVETIVKAYAREAQTKKGMDESQVTGAASSYARKYALNGLFLIDDVKDADQTNDHGKSGDQKPDHRQGSNQQSQVIQDDQWLDFYGQWNGRVYAGSHVYYNDVKYSLSEKQSKYLSDHPKKEQNASNQ